MNFLLSNKALVNIITLFVIISFACSDVNENKVNENKPKISNQNNQNQKISQNIANKTLDTNHSTIFDIIQENYNPLVIKSKSPFYKTLDTNGTIYKYLEVGEKIKILNIIKFDSINFIRYNLEHKIHVSEKTNMILCKAIVGQDTGYINYKNIALYIVNNKLAKCKYLITGNIDGKIKILKYISERNKIVHTLNLDIGFNDGRNDPDNLQLLPNVMLNNIDGLLQISRSGGCCGCTSINEYIVDANDTLSELINTYSMGEACYSYDTEVFFNFKDKKSHQIENSLVRKAINEIIEKKNIQSDKMLLLFDEETTEKENYKKKEEENYYDCESETIKSMYYLYTWDGGKLSLCDSINNLNSTKKSIKNKN